MAIQTEFIAKTEKISSKAIDKISSTRRKKISSIYRISKVASERNEEDKNLLLLADLTTYEVLKKKNHRKVSVEARIKEIMNRLRLAGFVHSIKNKASGNAKLNFLRDDEIVRKYNSCSERSTMMISKEKSIEINYLTKKHLVVFKDSIYLLI